MSFNNTLTPPRLPQVVGSSLQPIRREFLEQNKLRMAKHNIFWGAVNLILLSIIVNDLSSGYDKCNKYHQYFHYFEYFLAIIFLLNSLYHLYKYCTIGGIGKIETKPNPNHSINDVVFNSSLNASLSDQQKSPYQNIITSRFSKTPMDTSATSWLSTSVNHSLNITPWGMQAELLPPNNSPGFKSSPILPANLSNMALVDEQSLSHYLKEYDEAIETTQNVNLTEPTSNSLSFFWNHPATKIKDNSPLLRRCQYQLSTPSPTHSNSPKSDDKSSPLNQSQCSDTWKRLNVDSVALTQWTENLRIWISQTILCRLIAEFDTIDKSLHMQGLTDVSIGQVGIDRLRKTAQGQVLQNTPNLPTIVPFLELHPNQEYLVKRIRELSKGGCMSEYKWGGGGNYSDKEWDVSLPTDAAIAMHLISAYLDTQLVPLPNNPDVKPFSGFHFIKSTEKLPELTSSTLAIHEVAIKPPHYRVIIGTESYEMVKGYNNLFHSILLFLYHVNEREHGMLGRVNLGRSGLNMLWIINAT